MTDKEIQELVVKMAEKLEEVVEILEKFYLIFA